MIRIKGREGILFRPEFEQFQPDYQSMMLKTLAQDVIDVRGVIVTVIGSERYCNEHGLQFDFVSRYFAPWMGINEDPVTGLMLHHKILLMERTKLTIVNYTTPINHFSLE